MAERRATDGPSTRECAPAETLGGLPAITGLPGVIAGLAYVEPTIERPFNYMFDPPAGTSRHNCDYQVCNVRIADARTMSLSPGVHVEGFELRDAPTSVTDFTKEEEICNQYIAEGEELAKAVTGADNAYVFDHLVRRREPGRPALDFGRQGDGSRPGAAGRVHNDYSEGSGLTRLETVRRNFAIGTPYRFSIVNIWRSIAGKVVDTPLAICDARTVSTADMVTTDMLYPNRTGEIYLFSQSPRHRWYYYPEMDRHEALIFKQFDSQVSGVARFTPHAAFDLPDVPTDAPLRQSIELRCLVTYG